MELYIYFTINGEKYCMSILKRIIKPSVIFLHKETGERLKPGYPIDEIRTSTLKTMIKHWLFLASLKMAKYGRNK